jgi:peptidoglycan hydrolase-like protein with peptidoglycan-binding domain
MHSALGLAAIVPVFIFFGTATAQTTDGISALASQLATLQQQIQSVGAHLPPICQVTRYPLQRGDRGDDVTLLQALLRAEGIFSEEPTGFFGPITETALTTFQLRAGIIQNVSDGGVFGPRTFQYIQTSLCMPTPRTSSTAPQCSPPVQPNFSCPGGWQQFSNPDGCLTGWSCATYGSASSTMGASPNRPPIINSILGPFSVTAGYPMTWTITATDPDNDHLNYGMLWGDEGAELSQLYAIADQPINMSPMNTLTHIYANAGTFNAIAYVRDVRGNTSKGTFLIQVSAPALAPTVPTITSTSSQATSTPVQPCSPALLPGPPPPPLPYLSVPCVTGDQMTTIGSGQDLLGTILGSLITILTRLRDTPATSQLTNTLFAPTLSQLQTTINSLGVNTNTQAVQQLDAILRELMSGAPR